MATTGASVDTTPAVDEPTPLPPIKVLVASDVKGRHAELFAAAAKAHTSKAGPFKALFWLVCLYLYSLHVLWIRWLMLFELPSILLIICACCAQSLYRSTSAIGCCNNVTPCTYQAHIAVFTSFVKNSSL